MDVVDVIRHWEVKDNGTVSCGGDGVEGDERGDGGRDDAVGDLCCHWRRAHTQGTVVEGHLHLTGNLGRRG